MNLLNEIKACRLVSFCKLNLTIVIAPYIVSLWFRLLAICELYCFGILSVAQTITRVMGKSSATNEAFDGNTGCFQLNHRSVAATLSGNFTTVRRALSRAPPRRQQSESFTDLRFYDIFPIFHLRDLHFVNKSRSASISMQIVCGTKSDNFLVSTFVSSSLTIDK